MVKASPRLPPEGLPSTRLFWSLIPRELPSFQTPKLAYENSMLGVFSCDITVVANDVIMQRTQRCLGLSETRQVNRYIVIWLARALRALEASQRVIGLVRSRHRLADEVPCLSQARDKPAKVMCISRIFAINIHSIGSWSCCCCSTLNEWVLAGCRNVNVNNFSRGFASLRKSATYAHWRGFALPGKPRLCALIVDYDVMIFAVSGNVARWLFYMWRHNHHGGTQLVEDMRKSGDFPVSCWIGLCIYPATLFGLSHLDTRPWLR